MRTDCRHFTGAKPCAPKRECNSICNHYRKRGPRILIIHLGAMGAVLRSTAHLSAIKVKYPESDIHWVTEEMCKPLLENLNIFTHDIHDLWDIIGLEFEAVYTIDKSIKACSIAQKMNTKNHYGFKLDSQLGVIVPATSSAQELWEIGLSDQRKFFINKKTEIQLQQEALELPFVQQRYQIQLTQKERESALNFKKKWKTNGPIIGINTGASSTIAEKKLTINEHKKLITKLNKYIPNAQIVLLGGSHEKLQNQAIAAGFGDLVIVADSENGIRSGFTQMAACDFIFTGDSLGLHMAIALEIPFLAWFGPTCDHEIEFYGIGEGIKSSVSCSPCWLRVCDQKTKCHETLDFEVIAKKIQNKILISKEIEITF